MDAYTAALKAQLAAENEQEKVFRCHFQGIAADNALIVLDGGDGLEPESWFQNTMDTLFEDTAFNSLPENEQRRAFFITVEAFNRIAGTNF